MCNKNTVEELSKLISIGPIIVYTCEAFGEFAATSITSNIYNQLGYEAGEFIKTANFWALHIHPDDKKKIFDDLSNLFEKGEHSHEYRFLHNDGSYRWMHDELRLINGKDGQPQTIVGYWTDITERKLIEEKLEFMSCHDAVTQLPNRNLLMERLNSALMRSHRSKDKVAIIFIDLDNFKKINDNFGHNGGDHTLKTVAGRISSYLRETDTVARFGGDEFVVILQDIKNENDVSIKIKEIIELVSTPIKLDEKEAIISMSIGIAIYPNQNQSAQQLLILADNAMYRAKNNGKNCFQFSNG
jgi:diguanylate cyclase (GGDEF)-like protein/PAS domain S-box-containing protein